MSSRTIQVRAVHLKGELRMSVAKSIEVTASSTTSFDDALASGIAKVSESVNNIQSAWVKDQYVKVTENAIAEYRVNLKVTFVVD